MKHTITLMLPMPHASKSDSSTLALHPDELSLHYPGQHSVSAFLLLHLKGVHDVDGLFMDDTTKRTLPAGTGHTYHMLPLSCHYLLYIWKSGTGVFMDAAVDGLRA